MILLSPVQAQIGTCFPSERKVIKDSITGAELIFLTISIAGDSKIYQIHNQWTIERTTDSIDLGGINICQIEIPGI